MKIWMVGMMFGGLAGCPVTFDVPEENGQLALEFVCTPQAPKVGDLVLCTLDLINLGVVDWDVTTVDIMSASIVGDENLELQGTSSFPPIGRWEPDGRWWTWDGGIGSIGPGERFILGVTYRVRVGMQVVDLVGVARYQSSSRADTVWGQSQIRVVN